MQTLLDQTYLALRQRMLPLAESHTKMLWQSLHRGPTYNQHFTPPLQRWLVENFPNPIVPLEIVRQQSSQDGETRKYLLQLGDGNCIETVLMRFKGRHTACVSTQVGCAMGCIFCATGQMGFIRHLTTSEIVGQIVLLNRILHEDGSAQLRNIVLMGMGEPLHNYEATMAAMEIVSDTRGANIGPSRITISTVGVVPGILRMAEEDRPYNLAVSLHGSSQAERALLVPVAKKWPLEQLMTACRTYTSQTGRRIFFEWTLIEGRNDSPQQAEALAGLLDGIPGHVNLIPLNPVASYSGKTSGNALRFKTILRDFGTPVTIRQRRGIDVAAGCGQLAGAL